ncbi:MAG TPA: DUF4864 domain-containing protein [Opitutaceae bacterium]|nr:DUF4864 domain-containing protein [Opitutaceae bacterium]
MLRWSLLFTLVALVGAPLRGAGTELRASKAEVRKEVIAVIEAQLAALRAGDATRAYNLAAAPLRAQTPLRAFVAIVQTNYPEIWTSTRAEYGIVRDDGTRATVLVHVYSKDGDAPFDYVLLKERAGWRIGSVVRHVMRKKDDV